MTSGLLGPCPSSRRVLALARVLQRDTGGVKQPIGDLYRCRFITRNWLVSIRRLRRLGAAPGGTGEFRGRGPLLHFFCCEVTFVVRSNAVCVEYRDGAKASLVVHRR